MLLIRNHSKEEFGASTCSRIRAGRAIDWAATMVAPALYDLGTVAAVNADRPDRLRGPG
jgi:hypothetical protein